MAKLVIKYISIDPYYPTHTQTFIDSNIDDCWDQAIDYENWLGRNHPAGIKCIYKPELLIEKF